MATNKQGEWRTLTARLSERFVVPSKETAFKRRTWFSVTVAGVICIYAGAIAAFLLHDREQPVQTAELKETPVEIVAEPPPALKAPPTPAPAKPPAEKPATSAPRAFNETPPDAEARDAETHAPKLDEPAAMGAPPPDASEAQRDEPQATQTQPAPDQAKPEQTSDAKPDEPKPDSKPDHPSPKLPDVLTKDAEALDKVVPEPPKRPATMPKAEQTRQAANKPTPVKARHGKTAVQQLAGASPLPDYAFAKAMHKHPKVSGGTEDDRYLAVVYGLITQNRNIMAPDGDWGVAVAFEVDGTGNLVGVGIQQSSGYPQVDAAAVQAIEQAAPFPPPPSGARTGLVARLNSGGRAAAMAGDD